MKSLFRPSWMHTLLAPCHRHLSSLPTMPSTFVTPEFIRFPYRFARYITCMRDICQPNSRKTLTLLLLCSNSHITCWKNLKRYQNVLEIATDKDALARQRSQARNAKLYPTFPKRERNLKAGLCCVSVN